MNREMAKIMISEAVDNITRAAEAIENCYLDDEWFVGDADRLCQAIIQDVAAIMFYNRTPQTSADLAQNPGE